MTEGEPFNLPPEEAIAWFRRKDYRLAFDWRDVWQEEHRRAFTVAKAIQLGILADLREAVDQAIEEGIPLREFQKRITPILQRKGWWGEKEVLDPATGELKLSQLGSPRRLRTIYDTNLRQTHQAGHWQRIDRLKKARPYLRYIARSPGQNRRAEHQAWHNKVWHIDDPIWNTHAPMNGWGCACKVQQLNARDVERLGLTVSEAPAVEYRDWQNKRTGEVERVPVGIDPGFAYNPGRGGRFDPPPDDLPPVVPLRTAADYGRPRAKDVRARATAPKEFTPFRADNDRARLDRDLERLFGVERGHSGRAADPTGADVEFGSGLLDYLLKKGEQRERFLPHAKATVEDPFEIWLVPFRRRDGTVIMRKRYIGLFKQEGGKDRDMLVVVDEGGAYNIYPKSGIDAQREGYLFYPAPDPQ